MSEGLFLAALASLGPLGARALGAGVPAWAPLPLALLGLAAGLARALSLRPSDAAAAAALDRATGGTGRFLTLAELPPAHPFRGPLEREVAGSLPRAEDVVPIRVRPSATALVLAWAANAALLAIPSRAADPAPADAAALEVLAALPEDARPRPDARAGERLVAAARAAEAVHARAARAGESQAALERLARALREAHFEPLADALDRRDPTALQEAASRAAPAPGSGPGSGTSPASLSAALREAAADPRLARSARERLLDAAAAGGRGEGNAWLGPLERLLEDARAGAGGPALARAEQAARVLPPAPPAPVDPAPRAREAVAFESEAPPGFRDVARRYFLAVLAR